MTLKEFEKYMESSHNAYWTSFYEVDDNNVPKEPIRNYPKEDPRLDMEICQIDSIGLSSGTESLMIDLILFIGDADDRVRTRSKMLGSNLDTCLSAIKTILQTVKTSYLSVG